MASGRFVTILADVAAGTVSPAIVLDELPLLLVVLGLSGVGLGVYLGVDLRFKFRDHVNETELVGIVGGGVSKLSGCWFRSGVVSRVRGIDRSGGVVLVEEGLHGVKVWIGITKRGGSGDAGDVGVADFEFSLGVDEMGLEVGPGFLVRRKPVPETEVHVEDLRFLEHRSSHVDEVGIRLMGAEGSGHIFELAVVGEDDGQGLGVDVDLVGSSGSGDGDGTCGDVAVSGEEIFEKGRESDFDDTGGIVGDWCHGFGAEGFDDLIEEGTLNMVDFHVPVKGRVVDTVVFRHHGSSSSIFMKDCRW